ncbi:MULTISPECIES: hypothetical protein [Planktothricoides]|uniref:Uncharacterized protein n=2 Tax=Planktothricoides raciborskii TaxID=132608 RepID=A0AAU8JDV6_9CYAN|nr:MULTISPECIES: hypothetical protein [Planktothricoides]MBD2542407.1 hypothetical protein [Planktothricoides raciborskii FACHB-1370]MBD2582075.1 hypothetical protein [Planktothricoides raciborskii FACHB-1261]
MTSKQETRFLNLHPQTQKPGFFSGYQSYRFFANKKPGFFTPTVNL